MLLTLISARRSLVLLPLAGFAAFSCSSSSSSSGASSHARTDDPTASAVIELAVVPANVSCVEIDVTGARAVTDRFDVTPNETAVLSLTALPLGNVSFIGLAYPTACAAVTSAVQATWISPATPATLVPGTVANVSLVLVPNGQASVGVGFNPDDAGADAAADAAPVDAAADAAPVDAAPPFSFANPAVLQLPFNADTVATVGASSVTAVDGTSHALVTLGLASQLLGPLAAAPVALPDNATFAPVGTSMPAIQLGWAGAPGAASSVLLPSTTGATTTFVTPHGQFAHVQLYAMSTEGPATLDYTFQYASGPPQTASISVPDWCLPGAVGATVPVRASTYRLIVGDAGESVDVSASCNIYALDLNPDPTQTLTGLTLAPTGGASAAARFVAYGAAAW
jgi:hypothetical protein